MLQKYWVLTDRGEALYVDFKQKTSFKGPAQEETYLVMKALDDSTGATTPQIIKWSGLDPQTAMSALSFLVDNNFAENASYQRDTSSQY